MDEREASEGSLAIQQIFAEVPATYERLNHILTLGLDMLWRRQLVRIAAAAGGDQWADLCTGTGETAAQLVRLAAPGTTIHAVDFSEPMLEVARRKPEAARIRFVVSDIGSLPFADESMDLLTMSFAARNINLSREVMLRRLAEFCRVLRPGGCFVNLETSQPPWRPIRGLRDLYVRLFVEAVGRRVSGTRSAYAYLATTIPRFYTAEELAGVLREAGFALVTFHRFQLGLIAIHKAVKGS